MPCLYNLLLLRKGIAGSLPLNFPMGYCNLEGVICKQKTHCSYVRGALYFTLHTSISRLYQTGGNFNNALAVLQTLPKASSSINMPLQSWQSFPLSIHCTKMLELAVLVKVTPKTLMLRLCLVLSKTPAQLLNCSLSYTTSYDRKHL